jgi:hypothetical protein
MCSLCAAFGYGVELYNLGAILVQVAKRLKGSCIFMNSKYGPAGLSSLIAQGPRIPKLRVGCSNQPGVIIPKTNFSLL